MGKQTREWKNEQFGEWRAGRAPFYLNIAQVAEYYGLSPRTLKGLRQRRLVRFTRAGHRTILIDRESLEQYLRKRTSPAIGEVP